MSMTKFVCVADKRLPSNEDSLRALSHSQFVDDVYKLCKG